MQRQGVSQEHRSSESAHCRIGRRTKPSGIQHFRIRSGRRHEMGTVIPGDVGLVDCGIGVYDAYEQINLHSAADPGFIMKDMKLNPYGIAMARVYVQMKCEVIKGATSDTDQ